MRVLLRGVKEKIWIPRQGRCAKIYVCLLVAEIIRHTVQPFVVESAKIRRFIGVFYDAREVSPQSPIDDGIMEIPIKKWILPDRERPRPCLARRIDDGLYKRRGRRTRKVLYLIVQSIPVRRCGNELKVCKC